MEQYYIIEKFPTPELLKYKSGKVKRFTLEEAIEESKKCHSPIIVPFDPILTDGKSLFRIENGNKKDILFETALGYDCPVMTVSLNDKNKFINEHPDDDYFYASYDIRKKNDAYTSKN